MTVRNLEQFTPKDKSFIYTEVFVEFYNKKSHGQVYEMHGMNKLKKICTLIRENLYNLIAHQIIQILSVLYNTHIISRDHDKFAFFVNNYINWD